ncbi:MAG: hypothetical protein DCC75_12385 [Proteobacteria bacterium]|nr:MAG: hypothetical protein DCC75_12385 [Pseudomonadota bacterium]
MNMKAPILTALFTISLYTSGTAMAAEQAAKTAEHPISRSGGSHMIHRIEVTSANSKNEAPQEQSENLRARVDLDKQASKSVKAKRLQAPISRSGGSAMINPVIIEK